MKQATDLVPQAEAPAAAIADTQIIAIAEQAEKRIAAIKKIKGQALKLTSPHDWVDQNGRPYLQESGANKMAPVFGISYQISPELKKTTHEDGHYSFEVWGRFTMGLIEIDAAGTRSSRDVFFSRSHGEDVPPSEINENNVKKSAVSNCIGNGVRRMLGLKNLTWAEVEEYTGFTRKDVMSVDYKASGNGKTKPGPKTDKPAKRESQSSKLITKEQKSALWKMMKEKELSDTEATEFYHWALGDNPTQKQAMDFIANFESTYGSFIKTKTQGPPEE